jgi:hypothetical protein
LNLIEKFCRRRGKFGHHHVVALRDQLVVENTEMDFFAGFVSQTLNVGFGTRRVSVCTEPVTWCVKLTMSVSYWK